VVPGLFLPATVLMMTMISKRCRHLLLKPLARLRLVRRAKMRWKMPDPVERAERVRMSW
jgi:hypothetical protein